MLLADGKEDELLSVLFLLLASTSVLPTRALVSPEFETTPRQRLTFTEVENQYILTHKAVKIGYVANRVPVSFEDENGELGGISRNIFDHVSRLCVIKFEYIPLPEGEGQVII